MTCSPIRRNVGTAGMCSKCYREQQAQEQKAQEASEALASATTAPPADVVPTIPASPAPAAIEEAPAVEEPSSSTPAAAVAAASPAEPSKGPSRCFSCRKKVGLTGFKCKCGHTFCGQHRYAEAHECTFDYKTAQRAKLAENNPLVQAAKVEKI